MGIQHDRGRARMPEFSITRRRRCYESEGFGEEFISMRYAAELPRGHNDIAVGTAHEQWEKLMRAVKHPSFSASRSPRGALLRQLRQASTRCRNVGGSMPQKAQSRIVSV